MAADANIFAQYLRPVRSVQDYSNDMDAAEQNRLTLQSGRMKAQQDQLAVEDDNALRSAYQQSGGDNNALLKILQGGGRYKAADAVQKRIQEQLKGKSELDTADVNRRKSETEIIDKSLTTAKTFASQVVDKVGGSAYVNGLYADPVLGPLAQRMKPLQQALSEIPDDPAEFLRWKAGHMNITADKLIELLKPKTDITNMGANQSFGSTDQFTGQRTQTGSAPILESANNVANNERMVSEGDKTRAQALKVAGMVDARQRDRMQFDQGTAVADAGGPTQAAFTKQFGKAESGTRWRADGTLEFIPGGSKDPKNNAGTTAKVADAQDVLSLLDQALPLVEKSTGSYAGVGMDQAARVVGQSTEGSRAAAQLKVLEGSLISKMPKMSGPQSDKDVLLYKQMAGQIGDPTIPKDQKVAAMQTIREINERHAGGAAKPAGRTPVRTGKLNGRKVIEYSDGTTAYAD